MQLLPGEAQNRIACLWVALLGLPRTPHTSNCTLNILLSFQHVMSSRLLSLTSIQACILVPSFYSVHVLDACVRSHMCAQVFAHMEAVS